MTNKTSHGVELSFDWVVVPKNGRDVRWIRLAPCISRSIYLKDVTKKADLLSYFGYLMVILADPRVDIYKNPYLLH